jgi:hypothetical protein
MFLAGSWMGGVAISTKFTRTLSQMYHHCLIFLWQNIRVSRYKIKNVAAIELYFHEIIASIWFAICSIMFLDI